MWNDLYDLALAGTDLLFGWILLLPRDLSLVAVGVLTSLGIVLVRRWTTDQDRLAKSKQDMALLKPRIKEAKRSGDRETRNRLQGVAQRIAMLRLVSSGKPLLYALLPIAIISTWAFERLEFEPLKVGETTTVSLHLPLSAEGDIVHMMPTDGLEVASGLVRRLERDETQQPPTARAVWHVTLRQAGTTTVQLRTEDGACEHVIKAGIRRYAPARLDHAQPRQAVTTVALRELRLFGVIPGFPDMALPGWMVGYMLITIVFVLISGRVLKIA